MTDFSLDTPMFTGLETLRMNFLWSENEVGPNEWQWEGTDKPQMYDRARRGEFKTLYDENSFTYKVNSYFFRCPEFDDLDYTKPIFAVGGCSLTFGIGVPYEHTWAYIIWQKLKAEFPDTQYVNLAVGGSSIDFSVRALSCFGERAQHFDCYVNLLTEPSRREFVHEQCFYYAFVHYNRKEYHPNRDVHEAINWYAKTFAIDDYWTKYNLSRNLHMLDLTSRLYSMPMVLDFWGHVKKDNLPSINLVEEPFKKYFTNGFGTRFYADVDPSIPEELLNARDQMHPGKYLHERYAKNIYPQVREKFINSIKTKKGY